MLLRPVPSSPKNVAVPPGAAASCELLVYRESAVSLNRPLRPSFTHHERLLSGGVNKGQRGCTGGGGRRRGGDGRLGRGHKGLGIGPDGDRSLRDHHSARHAAGTADRRSVRQWRHCGHSHRRTTSSRCDWCRLLLGLGLPLLFGLALNRRLRPLRRSLASSVGGRHTSGPQSAARGAGRQRGHLPLLLLLLRR